MWGYCILIYDQDGHYDEVQCIFSKDVRFCGDCICPLDQLDREEGDR